MANRLTLDDVLARVVLQGDSDFALSDGCSSEGEGEGFSAYHSIEHKIELRSVLPDFLDNEREIPGYCVGQRYSITLQ